MRQIVGVVHILRPSTKRNDAQRSAWSQSVWSAFGKWEAIRAGSWISREPFRSFDNCTVPALKVLLLQ